MSKEKELRSFRNCEVTKDQLLEVLRRHHAAVLKLCVALYECEAIKAEVGE